MNLSDEKYSADDMDGSNQVSVPIMMSGWRLSSRTSRSGFLFFYGAKIYGEYLQRAVYAFCLL